MCREYDVPLPAAALQFVLGHPCIPAIVPGTRTVAQLKQNLAWISQPIPADLWSTLRANGLLREDVPVPSG